MANRYYIGYPRDFANEYTVYVAPDKAAAKKLEELIEDVSRITRKQAIERGWSRPKLARECGEQWFGGFVQGSYVEQEGLEGAIKSAIQGTLELIKELE